MFISHLTFFSPTHTLAALAASQDPRKREIFILLPQFPFLPFDHSAEKEEQTLVFALETPVQFLSQTKPMLSIKPLVPLLASSFADLTQEPGHTVFNSSLSHVVWWGSRTEWAGAVGSQPYTSVVSLHFNPGNSVADLAAA